MGRVSDISPSRSNKLALGNLDTNSKGFLQIICNLLADSLAMEVHVGLRCLYHQDVVLGDLDM